MATWHRVVDGNGNVKYMDDKDYNKYKNRGGCLAVMFIAAIIIGSFFSKDEKKSESNQSEKNEPRTESVTSNKRQSNVRSLLDVSNECEEQIESQKDEDECTEEIATILQEDNETMELENESEAIPEEPLSRKERRAIKKAQRRAEKERIKAEMEQYEGISVE